MLVLTRKADEAISIGDSICVKVLEIRGNKVRLGIEAPSNVRIERHELHDRSETAIQEVEFELPLAASRPLPLESRTQHVVSRRAGTARPPARA